MSEYRGRNVECDSVGTNNWPCSSCLRLKLFCVGPGVLPAEDLWYRTTPRRDQDPSEEIQTQTISIPEDVFPILSGRGGSHISEIHRSSGADISIARAPSGSDGEAIVTVVGSVTSNALALDLLHEIITKEEFVGDARTSGGPNPSARSHG